MTAILILDILAATGIAGFAVLGILLPLGAIGWQFIPNFRGVFDPEVLAAARITVFQAGVSALVATGLGIIAALLIPRKRWSRIALGIPFGVPAVTAAAAWTICLPRSLSFSLTAVIIAHVFFNAPWVALWVMRAIDEVPLAQKEAAATLGASRWRVFREIILPSISPTVASVFTQVFSFCAMSFVLVMILGGGPPVDTLETVLFARIRAGGLDLSGASVCAFWQILITLTPWILLRRTRIARIGGARAGREMRPQGSSAKYWVGGMIALGFILPYLVLFYHPGLQRLWSDPQVRSDLGAALWTSLVLSATTAFLSLLVALLGVWAEQRSLLFEKLGSLVLVLPSGISVMVLGLGFFIAFGKWLDPFSPSIWPIAFLQSVFFVPVAFRIFQPVSKSRDRPAWDAALTLGASPVQAFSWVEWPRWRGPVIGAFAMVAGAALGEVAAVSLFYNENRIPVSLLVFRWMGQYRFDDARALSVFLMIPAALLISAGFWRSPELEAR